MSEERSNLKVVHGKLQQLGSQVGGLFEKPTQYNPSTYFLLLGDFVLQGDGIYREDF